MNNLKEIVGEFIKVITWICISMLLLIMLVSCRSAKPIYKEDVKHDTIINTLYKDKLVYDSIYKYDSVFVKVNGDTVYIEKDRYLFKYLYKHDTICKTDTLIKYDTVTEIKEIKGKSGEISLIRLLVVLSSFLLGAGLTYKIVKRR